MFARLIKTRPKHVCVRVYLGKITAEIDKIKLRVQVSEIRLEFSYTQGSYIISKIKRTTWIRTNGDLGYMHVYTK